MEDHDGAAVHDEAHPAPERAVEPLGKIEEDLNEELACERDFVQFVGYGEWRECDRVRFGGIGCHFGEI